MNLRSNNLLGLDNDSVKARERDEATRAHRIEIFIDHVTNILRFIDRKILVNIRVHVDNDELKFVPEYHPANGILVYTRNADHREDAKVMVKINEVFPAEQKEDVYSHLLRGGEEVYLLRNGILLEFERKGGIWDAGTAEQAGDYYSLANPQKREALDLVKKFENFGADFLFHFKLAVVNAIKKNENKRFQLKKIIEYIHRVELRERKAQDFKDAIAVAPQDPNAYLEYADFLYQDKEDAEGAKEQFAKALALDPQNAHTYLKTGEFWLTLSRRAKYSREKGFEEYRQKAGFNFLRALELASESSAAHSSYAGYLWMGDTKEKLHLLKKEIIDEVEMHYQRALELDPANSDAMTDYSFFLYWVKRDYEKAIQLCDKLVELEPHSDGVHMNCAGIISMAHRDFRLNSELKRQWTAEQEAGLLDKAHAWYRKAVEIAPEKGYVHVMYADFLQWEKKDVPAAEKELLRAIELYPSDLWCFMRYGDLLLLMKQDREGAEKQYRKALLEAPLDDNRIRGFLSLRIASIEFLTGRESEALDRLEAIITAGKDVNILLAGNFYNYAHTENADKRERSRQAVKALLDNDVRINQWAGLETVLADIPLHVKQAKVGHPDPKFLSRLGKVVSGILPINILEKE